MKAFLVILFFITIGCSSDLVVVKKISKDQYKHDLQQIDSLHVDRSRNNSVIIKDSSISIILHPKDTTHFKAREDHGEILGYEYVGYFKEIDCFIIKHISLSEEYFILVNRDGSMLKCLSNLTISHNGFILTYNNNAVDGVNPGISVKLYTLKQDYFYKPAVNYNTFSILQLTEMFITNQGDIIGKVNIPNNNNISQPNTSYIKIRTKKIK